MIKRNSIINDDCFNVFPKISPKSVDMVLVDLPYGQTACKWDKEIDLDKMWEQLKLICKENCQFVFFTTTKLMEIEVTIYFIENKSLRINAY